MWLYVMYQVLELDSQHPAVAAEGSTALKFASVPGPDHKTRHMALLQDEQDKQRALSSISPMNEQANPCHQHATHNFRTNQ